MTRVPMARKIADQRGIRVARAWKFLPEFDSYSMFVLEILSKGLYSI